MNSIKQACARLGRFGDAGPALARMLLGFLFVWHGVAKFNDGKGLTDRTIYAALK